jgi:iron complex outermembrane receptor protein
VLNIVPPDSGRLWANYKFDGPWRGWSAGAGVYAASGAYVDPANLYKTAGFATVDAKIAYEHEHFAASVDVKNLLGAHYLVPFNYYGGRVAPGDERAVYGKVAVKF